MKTLKIILNRSFVTFFLSMGLLSAFSSQAIAEDKAKDITFVSLDGKKTQLSDYKGKWVVVNLWATWCPPCLEEIPDLGNFHEAHKNKDAIVIGVNYEDNDPQLIRNFMESQMVNYDIVRFEGDKVDGRTSPFGPLRGLPTTYMVSPEGDIVAARTGTVDQAMLEDFIKAYQASKK